ncbi:hypothetical protein GUJ93_ZPchr0008g14192 [Zizania palustris]|uniref:RING-type E3 ubiquitin transferase n=1 Tax=Zizania palustris TaxID=103762 RepID=A0A8J5RKF7_ZIZPA|nr:hypothetical protein GUJ93_ZPchr0008g14192 [Zizania palustris]
MSASPPPPNDGAAGLAEVEEEEAASVTLYCYECEGILSLPAPPPPPRVLCPHCRLGYLEENSPPPPPPPPGFLSDSSSDEGGDLDLGMDPAAARAYLSRLVHHHLYDDPIDVATTAAAAVSVIQSGQHSGHPPASAASIATLPTVEWLKMRNSCPVCRSCLPSTDSGEAAPSDQRRQPTRIRIRFTTNRRRVLTNSDAGAPVAASPTQLAQVVTGGGLGGSANSTETVSSEWPRPPESDSVLSQAREGQGFFD